MAEVKNKPRRHITREQILLAILISLIIIIAVLLIRALTVSQLFQKSSVEAAPQVPLFLSVPLPSLKNIQDALNDPRLDDLQFYHIIGAPPGQNKSETLEDLAKQVKIGNIGRPDPFVPFVQSPAKK